jgi:hypothetical protein
LIDDEEKLKEIKNNYQTGSILLPDIIALRESQSGQERHNSIPSTKHAGGPDLPKRRSDREKRKPKHLVDDCGNDQDQIEATQESSEPNSSKGKAKKVCKAEKASAYLSTLNKIAESREQVN